MMMMMMMLMMIMYKMTIFIHIHQNNLLYHFRTKINGYNKRNIAYIIYVYKYIYTKHTASLEYYTLSVA